MKARGVMKRDIDYVVKDGEVIIVDEFTGRLMHGPPLLTRACTRPSRPRRAWRSPTSPKRWPPSPSRTSSACTDKLSGMTGTALTEEEEFSTRSTRWMWWRSQRTVPVARMDYPDVVYKTEAAKYRAVHARRSRSVMRRASRCWWVPSPLKNRSCSPTCSTKEGIRHTVLERQAP